MNVLVVNGGPPPHPSVPRTGFDLVIAVDSGADHARRLGVVAHVVVGDLDSISAEALTAAEQDGVEIERHPPDKDFTDLELALELALDRGARSITVVGATDSDRLDHTVAALTIMGSRRWAGMEVRAYMGPAEVLVVHGGRTLQLHGRPGDQLSILALHGAAHGVYTSGLRFPLDGGTVDAGVGLGISNELVRRGACVSVATGTLTVIRPHALEGAR